MAHVIGKGRKASETYPESKSAGASAIARLGFANSVEEIQYDTVDAFNPVLRSAGVPLTVPLTGFRPGNVILIGYSFAGEESISSGSAGIAYDVEATVDVNGGGQKRIVSGLIGIGISGLFPAFLAFNGAGWITFYKPPAVDVTATPIVGLAVNAHFGFDPVRVRPGSALLVAIEVDAAFVTQNPDTTLVP